MTTHVQKVAIATATQAIGFDEDEPLLVAAFEAVGMAAVPVPWNAPGVDWSGFDTVVVRSTWDYPTDRDGFLAWASSIDHGRLFNDCKVLAWNTDKTYLKALASAGVPVVPTEWIDVDAADVALPQTGDFVVKPAVSAGSKDTVRFRSTDHADAVEHVRQIQESGRVTMVQPYVASVDATGEAALLYIDGQFSHAVRKGQLLTVGQGLVEGLYAEEEISARQPRGDERALADAVIATAADLVGELVYARVDLVDGADGAPMLLELELTEPSLFLTKDENAAARLAGAVSSRLG